MSFVAVGIAGVSLLASAKQAEDIRGAATFSKDMGELNARNAELDAFKAEQAGYADAARYQEEIDKTVADQRGAFAASDVDVNFGTAKEVQAESKMIGALNILDIKTAASYKARGYLNEANLIRQRGDTGARQGKVDAEATMNAGAINAANVGYSGYNRFKDTKKGT